MAVADQLRLELVHPVRIGLAQAGPFVAGTLCEAFQVNELAVKIDAARAGAAFEFGLAKPGGDLVDVNDFAVHLQNRVNVVKIWVFRTPEARLLKGSGCGQDALFAVYHIDGAAVEAGANLPLAIHNHSG